MKRKIGTLFLVMIMCVSAFAGCSLVGRNDKIYFEAPVATISYVTGEKEDISKRDLISAYNSYGYNYVDNYGMTKKEAVKKTIDTIVDKKLTIKAVKNYYEQNPSAGEILNGNETTYVWDQTYDALYSNLKEYLNKVVDYTKPENKDETNANKSIYTPYKKGANLEQEDGKWIIKKTTPASTIRESYDGRTNLDGDYFDFEFKDSESRSPFKEAMYTKLYDAVGTDNSQSSKNWKSAFNNYIADIKTNYTYIDLKNDKEYFMFEMDRVYNILKDNYLVEKYEVIYNSQKQQDLDLSNVTVDNILKYYSSKVRADYTSYVSEGGKATFESSILSDTANVDYILEGNNASNYFYVGSVKMEMTAEQKTVYSDLKTALANGTTTPIAYKAEVDKLYGSIAATKRDAKTGEKTNEKISASNLLLKIDSEVSAIKYSDDTDLTSDYNKAVSYQKGAAFRNYMYLYNDDETLKGTDFATVFGVDSSNKVLAPEAFASNEDLKDEVLALYNNGEAKVGDMTKLVRAEDGIYLFFYAGDVENLFGGVDQNFDASKQEQNIRVLASSRLNVFSGKTMFDKIYEALVKDNFSVFQNMNINYLRTSLTSKIESIENNFKDLY